MKSKERIWDRLLGAAAILKRFQLVDDSDLLTLRQLIDHHRVIHEKPLGDPAYNEIVDLDLLLGFLRLWIDLIEEFRCFGLQEYLDPDTALPGKAAAATLDSARFEESIGWLDQAKSASRLKWNANFNSWTDLNRRIVGREIIIATHFQGSH